MKPRCQKCIQRQIECVEADPAASLRWLNRSHLFRKQRRPNASLIEANPLSDAKAVAQAEESKQHDILYDPPVASGTPTDTCNNRLGQTLPIYDHLSGDTHTQEFLVEYYFLAVSPTFTIFNGSDDPFGSDLRPYVSQKGPLIETLAAIALLHLSDSLNDESIVHQAFSLRSRTIVCVRERLEHRPQIETIVACLLLATTEVSLKCLRCGTGTDQDRAISDLHLTEPCSWIRQLKSLPCTNHHNALYLGVFEIS